MRALPLLPLAIGFIAGCLFTVVFLLVLARWLQKPPVERPTGAAPADGAAEIVGILRPLHQQSTIPALGAAVVTSEGLRAQGVIGWRRQGGTTAVTSQDAWHLGSDAKAMTATLAAILVQQGRLRWDTRLAEVVPELVPRMALGWSEVTLDQLLCHRSGAPANVTGEPPASRREVIAWMTATPRESTGEAPFRYSNVGYVVAGAMMEAVTGQTWEDLIAKELWHPLGMVGCGFGGMGTPGQEDGLWGHDQHGQPKGNGPGADNPPLLGPAGTVHMPLEAWAKFVADQLAGAQGRPALLPADAYRHLHQPWPGGEYARGWTVVSRSWAKGPALTHGGSNTMNSALVWMAPGIDRAFLVVANQEEAFGVLDTVVGQLLEHYPAKSNAGK